ncbi:acyltransferase family protein [Huintestinicola sp.]
MNNSPAKASLRNVSIDIWRILAIFLVMTNHYWGLLSDIQVSRFKIVNFLESFGGEIGVTIFFIISGYGIYCSLNKSFNDKSFSYKDFTLKRMNRILPQYYVSILLILLLMDGAYYLSITGFKDIGAHFLLVHNVIPAFSGSINGPLWALGVIFHFYLAAPLIYKCIKENPLVTLFLAVTVTFVSKYLLLHIIFPNLGLEGYNFWGGRNLLTSSIDNFVLGMLLAYVWNEYSAKAVEKLNKKAGTAIGIIIVLLAAAAVWLWCGFCSQHGIHTDNLSGYLFHTVLAALCCMLIGGMSLLQIVGVKYDLAVFRLLRWVSKYEYAIFLWHYPLVANLVAKSDIMIKLKQNCRPIAWLVSFAVVIAFGIGFTKVTENIKIVKDKRLNEK